MLELLLSESHVLTLPLNGCHLLLYLFVVTLQLSQFFVEGFQGCLQLCLNECQIDREEVFTVNHNDSLLSNSFYYSMFYRTFQNILRDKSSQ